MITPNKLLEIVNTSAKKYLNANSVFYEDYHLHNRKKLVLEGGVDVRAFISAFTNKIDDEKLIDTHLSKYGIKIIDKHNKFPSYTNKYGQPVVFDCRDWAFYELNLPKYTSKEEKIDPTQLLFGDTEDITWSIIPKINSIVTYFNSKSLCPGALHWGIVKEIKDDIIVHSKFGGNHVFEHPLYSVPQNHGAGVMFFDKVNK